MTCITEAFAQLTGRSFYCRGVFPLRFSLPSLTTESGGMGIRTPDIQLAKLALYQLSYTPVGFWPAGCPLSFRKADVGGVEEKD